MFCVVVVIGSLLSEVQQMNLTLCFQMGLSVVWTSR